jgi:hypothetical protein
MNQNESRESRSGAGYSSDVRLFLLAGGQSYTRSQIGPNFVRLRAPAFIPAGEAEVLMLVDGVERRWPETLEIGSVPFDEELDVATVAR